MKLQDATSDDSEHQKTIDAVRDLYYSLERPGDTAHRLIFQARMKGRQDD